jgi:predicted phosphoribosyltransferase
MRFKDRADAGRKLAAALARYKDQRPIVLALPRGGVPVAAEVASALAAPLDIILVRKIGAPMQPELALGAIVDGGKPVVVRNQEVIDATSTTDAEFEEIRDRELAEIESRRVHFLGGRRRLNPEGRVVIVVDDGIATGATMRAALEAIRQRNPEKLILAVPVAPNDTMNALRREVDDDVCLANLDPYGAIGYFYADFRQTTDREVIDALDRFGPERSESTPMKVGASSVRHMAGDIVEE